MCNMVEISHCTFTYMVESISIRRMITKKVPKNGKLSSEDSSRGHKSIALIAKTS
jgi:hypothetical protein